MAKKTKTDKYKALIQEIKTNLKTRLGDLMSNFFNNVDDTFFDLADKAINNKDQSLYFELMRNVRETRSEISTKFLLNIDSYLKPFAESENSKAEEKENLEDELSLVGQEEIEDMVMIKNIGERIAVQFREPLSHLEARLEHLALKTPEIFSKDALLPINICQAFDDALGDRFDIESKRIFFDIFNNDVAKELSSVYGAINNLLIDAGVLPQIKLTAKYKPTRNKEEPNTSDQAEIIDEPENAETQPQAHGSYALTATPGTTYGRGPAYSARGGAGGGNIGAGGGATGGNVSTGGVAGGGAAGGNVGAGGIAGGGGGTAGGNVGAGGTASGGTAGGNVDAGGGAGGSVGSGGDAGTNQAQGNYSHHTAGLPANHVSDVIGQFLGSPISTPSDDNDAESQQISQGTSEYFGHTEILQALSSIQDLPQFKETENLKFDADAVKSALLSAIAKQSGGVVTKRINQIAEKTIDFIELIFDAIVEDDSISDTIKALLLRLQIPVIKASMVDQEFFIYDDHPARVLLDKISEVGVGVTNHDDEIFYALAQILTTLVNEFDIDTESFQIALTSLNKFIYGLEEKARIKEQESQQQVLREHARNTVLKALRIITSGKELPEAIHPLVLKRWPTLMFNHYLQFGKENDEWIIIIEVLRDIIHSVQPVVSAENVASLLSRKDSLVKQAHDHLYNTNQSRKDIDNVIEGLKTTHELIINESQYTSSEIEEAEKNITTTDTDEAIEVLIDPDEISAADKLQSLPDDVQPGVWFKVHTGEDTVARRLKLSVILVEDSRLLFVNYGGEVVIEKEFEEFSEELNNSQSSVIMGHSVFDHALNSVITKLDPV